MLQDLPNYDPGNSLSWDEAAMMGCVCDGGFFGPDCSMRKCPYGDDPATVCDQTQNVEQVQEVTFKLPINFDTTTNPASHVGLAVGIVGSQFSLSFTGPTGVTFNTTSIVGAWGSATTSAAAVIDTASYAAATPLTGTSVDTGAAKRIELALESLPNYAVRDVTVQHYSRAISGTQYLNKYRVTFHHLNRNQNSYGIQELLGCHIPAVCAGPGCQPRVRQPYALAIFEGSDAGAMSQVALASLDTLEANVASSAGTWVRFHSDSVLQCPTGASCPAHGVKSKLFAGLNVVFETVTNEVWLRAFGTGDPENIVLHGTLTIPAPGTGEIASVTTDAGSWAYRPSTANRDTAARGYVFAGTLSDANEGKLDISHVIPNTWLEFESTTSGGTTKVASMFFQPAECTVADVTQAGLALSNPDVENIECSARGECNRADGTCQCYEGYTGHNCGTVTTVV